MNFKNIISFTFFLFIFNISFAAGGNSFEMKAVYDINNKASLQRGAKYYVNYCMGCHSLKYLRYSNVAKDLDIDPEIFEQNLIFSSAKLGDNMIIPMNKDDAISWFGALPPDLSLTARSRGANWIYSYLNSYYVDDKRPTGFNNLTYPNTAMPHVLADLQGEQILLDDGQNKFEISSPGSYDKINYQKATNDITNFLVYASEPIKSKRHAIGFWVLLFIFAFTVIAYYTKKEYWKDYK